MKRRSPLLAAATSTAVVGSLGVLGITSALAATGQSSANGTQLQIWTCTGTANQNWNLSGGSTPTDPPATAPSGLNPAVAPGGNFNLGIWNLQLPTGSYNQSSSESSTNGAKVKFYTLTVTHG